MSLQNQPGFESSHNPSASTNRHGHGREPSAKVGEVVEQYYAKPQGQGGRTHDKRGRKERRSKS